MATATTFAGGSLLSRRAGESKPDGRSNADWLRATGRVFGGVYFFVPAAIRIAVNPPIGVAIESAVALSIFMLIAMPPLLEHVPSSMPALRQGALQASPDT